MSLFKLTILIIILILGISSGLFTFLISHHFIILGLFFISLSLFFFRLYCTSTSKQKIKSDKPLPKELELEMNKNENGIYENKKGDDIMSKDIDLRGLSPHDGLDVEKFAEMAASFFDNPDKYADFVTGWFHRSKVKRTDKAVSEINSYLINLRNASASATQLQEEIIRNKIVFKHQAFIAARNLHNDLEKAQSKHENEMMVLDMEKSRITFMKNFFDNVKIDQLSNDERALLFSQQSINISGNADGSFSDQKVNPIDVLSLGNEQKILDIRLRQMKLELEAIKAETDKRSAEAVSAKAQSKIDNAKADHTVRSYQK